LRFAWPFIAGDGEFYNLAYPYSDYPEERWEFDQTVQALPAVLGAEGPVLEIGSGFGHFLRKIAPAQVPPGRVVAVEYNDVARQRLKALGFNAVGEDIRSAAFDHLSGQLAAVFMFQVLEHLDDLGGLLQRLNQLLRPGACVFMAVPNPERIEFNESNGALFDMPPNHISRWTESAFKALASRAGWTLTDYCTEPLHWRDLVKQDFVYSHMRRSQVTGSLANLARGRPRTRSRLAMEAAVALLAVPGRVPAWVRAATAKAPLGDSVWAQFSVQPATDRA
jgi:SAM-dependent methyltransferase